MSARCVCCGHIHLLRLYGCPMCEAAERRVRDEPLTGGSAVGPTSQLTQSAPSREDGESR